MHSKGHAGSLHFALTLSLLASSLPLNDLSGGGSGWLDLSRGGTTIIASEISSGRQRVQPRLVSLSVRPVDDVQLDPTHPLEVLLHGVYSPSFRLIRFDCMARATAQPPPLSLHFVTTDLAASATARCPASPEDRPGWRGVAGQGPGRGHNGSVTPQHLMYEAPGPDSADTSPQRPDKQAILLIRETFNAKMNPNVAP